MEKTFILRTCLNEVSKEKANNAMGLHFNSLREALECIGGNSTYPISIEHFIDDLNDNKLDILEDSTLIYVFIKTNA